MCSSAAARQPLGSSPLYIKNWNKILKYRTDQLNSSYILPWQAVNAPTPERRQGRSAPTKRSSSRISGNRVAGQTQTQGPPAAFAAPQNTNTGSQPWLGAPQGIQQPMGAQYGALPFAGPPPGALQQGFGQSFEQGIEKGPTIDFDKQPWRVDGFKPFK